MHALVPGWPPPLNTSHSSIGFSSNCLSQQPRLLPSVSFSPDLTYQPQGSQLTKGYTSGLARRVNPCGDRLEGLLPSFPGLVLVLKPTQQDILGGLMLSAPALLWQQAGTGSPCGCYCRVRGWVLSHGARAPERDDGIKARWGGFAK